MTIKVEEFLFQEFQKLKRFPYGHRAHVRKETWLFDANFKIPILHIPDVCVSMSCDGMEASPGNATYMAHTWWTCTGRALFLLL